MAFTNPVALYTEHNALNGGTLPAGGTWKLDSASPYDGNLCTSADGVTFANQSITVGVTLLAGGASNPRVDFTGVACGVSAESDGVFVFRYTVTNGDCTASSTLTVTTINNVVTISRENDACSYHLDIVNPSTPLNITHKDGSYNKVAPNVFLTNEYVSARIQYQARVTRQSLENCSEGASVSTVFSANGTLGQSHAAWTALKPGGASFYGMSSPHIQHSVLLDVSGWVTGVSYISGLKTSAGYVDLSSVLYTGTAGSFATALNAAIEGPMTALAGSNTLYNCIVGLAAGANIKFTFDCAHNVTNWVGIDKTDVEFQICLGGGCSGGTCGMNGITCITPAVTQAGSGAFGAVLSDVYETPCGDSLSIYFTLCPNRNDIEYFDLASSNFNTYALVDANGRGYNTAAAEGTNTQYAICQTIELTANTTDCPSPSYEWSNMETTQVIEADTDVGYTVTTDCEGCEDTSSEYCITQLNDVDAGFLICKDSGDNNVTIAMSASNSSCTSGTKDYSAVEFFDTPNICTPAYSSPQSVLVGIPTDVMPGTYFIVHRIEDSLGRKSNYAIMSITLFRSSGCCNALL